MECHLSDVKGGRSVRLLVPRVWKMQILLLIWAHLKVRFCPAAVAKGAVSAESVALSAWCKEKKHVNVERQHVISSLCEVSACGELCRKTTSQNVDKNIFLSLTTKTLQLQNMSAGRGKIKQGSLQGTDRQNVRIMRMSANSSKPCQHINAFEISEIFWCLYAHFWYSLFSFKHVFCEK